MIRHNAAVFNPDSAFSFQINAGFHRNRHARQQRVCRNRARAGLLMDFKAEALDPNAFRYILIVSGLLRETTVYVCAYRPHAIIAAARSIVNFFMIYYLVKHF